MSDEEQKDRQKQYQKEYYAQHRTEYVSINLFEIGEKERAWQRKFAIIDNLPKEAKEHLLKLTGRHDEDIRDILSSVPESANFIQINKEPNEKLRT